MTRTIIAAIAATIALALPATASARYSNDRAVALAQNYASGSPTILNDRVRAATGADTRACFAYTSSVFSRPTRNKAVVSAVVICTTADSGYVVATGQIAVRKTSIGPVFAARKFFPLS